MRTVMVAVGRGEGPGIHSRTFSINQGDGSNGSSNVPAKAGDWAKLSQTLIPPNEQAFGLRISRHTDSVGRVWTWVGWYAGAKFVQELRGGHYVGIGIAVADCLPSGDIVDVLEKLCGLYIEAVSNHSVISMSVDRWQPGKEDLALLSAIQFKELPERFSGIQPGKGNLLQHYLEGWNEGALRKIVDQILSDDQYRGFSSVFLNNWAQDKKSLQLYDATSHEDAVSAHRQDSPRARPATQSRGRPSDPWPSAAYRDDDDINSPTALRRKIILLERRLSALERKGEQGHHRFGSSERPTFTGLVLTLLSLAVVLDIVTLVSQFIR